ncbi:MAG: hypothetical protein ACPHJ3_17150, partial [Rubripirellula sp.]
EPRPIGSARVLALTVIFGWRLSRLAWQQEVKLRARGSVQDELGPSGDAQSLFADYTRMTFFSPKPPSLFA